MNRRGFSSDLSLQNTILKTVKNVGPQLGFSEESTSLSHSPSEAHKSELSLREKLMQPNAEGMISISFEDLRRLEPLDRDWTAFDALTDEDIAKAVANDPDAAPIDMDWTNAVILDLMPKTAISFRVDTDVYEFFKAKGKGFQTRMNAVLRAYVDHQRKVK